MKRLLIVSLLFISCATATKDKPCQIFTTDLVTILCGININFNHGNGYLIESNQVDYSKAFMTTNGVQTGLGNNTGTATGVINREFEGCDNLVLGTFYSLKDPTCRIVVTTDNRLEVN